MSFLEYCGKCNDIVKGYKFTMSKNNKIYYLEKDSFSKIADPTIDYTFKQIFAQNEEITKALLNAFLFPENAKIYKIDFLPTEHPGYGPYSSGSIRMDVICKCHIKDSDQMDIEEAEEEEKEKEDKKEINLLCQDGVLIVDIEMQIGYKKTNDARFLKYVKILDKKYGLMKVLVLALIYNPRILQSRNNNTSETSFAKTFDVNKYKIVNRYEDCVVYQIDLNYCYKMMTNNQNIYILKEKLLEKGLEWIKFLTLSIWCERIEGVYFKFPPLQSIEFKEEQLKEAFKILINQGISYEKRFVDQCYLIDDIKNYQKLKKENEDLKKKLKIKEKKESDESIKEKNLKEPKKYPNKRKTISRSKSKSKPKSKKKKKKYYGD